MENATGAQHTVSAKTVMNIDNHLTTRHVFSKPKHNQDPTTEGIPSLGKDMAQQAADHHSNEESNNIRFSKSPSHSDNF